MNSPPQSSFPLVTRVLIHAKERNPWFPRHSIVLSGEPLGQSTPRKFKYTIRRSDKIIESNCVTGNVIGTYPVLVELQDGDTIHICVYNLIKVSALLV